MSTSTPRRDCHAIHVEPFDLWVMLTDTVRYSMGRQSTAPYWAAEFVKRYARHLDPDQRRQIRDEVARELADAEESGHTLGAECDHLTWTTLVQWLDERSK